LAPGEINRLSIKPIAMIEFELCKGQVTDALEGLRLALGEKSLVSGQKLRNATANGQHTEHGIMFISLMLMLESIRSTYRQARNALQRLLTDPATWRRFKTSRHNLKVAEI